MSHVWYSTYLAILFFAVPGLCWTVQLSYSPTKVGDNSMADFMNVTMTTEDNQSFSLSLRKVVHMSSHIPVHTLVQTSDGTYATRHEMLGASENTAYYQDLNSEAVIQVKKTDEASDALSPLLQFKGQFRYNGSLYFVHREPRAKRDVTSSVSRDENVYTLQEQPEMMHAFDAGITNSKVKTSGGDNSQENPTLKSILRPQPHLQRRVRRENNPTYYIDIVAFVDFRAYSRFMTSGKSKEEVLRSVLEYYTYIITGADLLYQGITTTSFRLRVNLIKVVVAENSTDSKFTEQYRNESTPYATVYSNSSLNAFRDFVNGTGRDAVGPYDHVMLFTGNDLITSDSYGNVSKEIAGQAFTSTLCDTDGGSSSIIEDLGGYRCITTAAHELGHSISANHDGDGNRCEITDRYIMASVTLPETDISTRLHPWKFSNCSLEYFTEFIGKLEATESGAECLNNKLTADPNIPDVGDSLPGLNLTANEQCGMFVGNNESSLCPMLDLHPLPSYNLFENPSLICTAMYCKVPDTSSCELFSALRGTVCGNGKLCISGECVAHTSAPQKKETCVFGDDPLFIIDNLSCAAAVKEKPFICYNNAQSCCESCEIFYKWPGCEYGDTAKNCTTEPRFCELNPKTCCGTCGYGSSTSTTTTISPSTTTTTTPPTTTKPTIPTITTKPTTKNIPTATSATTTTTTPTTTIKPTTTTTPTTTTRPATASTQQTHTTAPTAAQKTATKPATTTTQTTTTTPTTITTPTTTTTPTTIFTPTTPTAPTTTTITSQSSAPMTTLQKLFVGVPVGVGSLVIVLIAGYLIYYAKFNKNGNFFKFRNSFDSNRSAPERQKANNFRFVSRTTSSEGILQWKDIKSSNTSKHKNNTFLNVGV